MSGGVDSSLAAALLKEAGAEVLGVFLNVWDYSRENAGRHGSCCALEDAYDARRVADRLRIPFYVMDMRTHFRTHVIDPFIRAYESGRTPNPCERCNRFVKFGTLMEVADRLDAPYIATGHYVRRRDDDTGVRIFTGADFRKDQSYFLATTARNKLERILFPVGAFAKDETRRLARAFGLPTAEKRESQDICFVPGGDHVAFLRREGAASGLLPGDIVDTNGRVLGRHDGIARYTLGQRKGLGLAGGPWLVVALEPDDDRVVVAHPEEALVHTVKVKDMVWIRRPVPGEELGVRLRYRMQPAACCARWEAGGARLRFGTPQLPAAPGQVAAFYAGEELLGGGIIARSA